MSAAAWPIASMPGSSHPTTTNSSIAKRKGNSLTLQACREVIESKDSSFREKLRAAEILQKMTRQPRAKPRGKSKPDVTKGNIRELLSEAASSPAVRQET